MILESIAGRERAAFEPGGEPAHALLRRAMREGIGHHPALSLLLQPVISNRCRSLQRRLDVARLDEIPLRLRTIGPHSREAIGLQLDAHLQPVGRGPVESLLGLAHLRKDSELILHVMTYFMRNHIGLRELAGFAVASAEALLDITEE